MIKLEWIEGYVTFRNYFNKGQGEINLFKGIAKDCVYVLGAVFFNENLGLLPTNIFNILVVGLFVFSLFFSFVLGWWWDSKKAYNIEADWGYKRSGLSHLIKNKKGVKK